ncbi:MAG: hypothetical protein IPN62_03665 [Flavobacteriales bacterium]|nr:hypothetical protein [Flavobacteriales bacterium]
MNGTEFGSSDNVTYVFPRKARPATVEDSVNYCLSTVGQTIEIVCPGDASFTTSATTILPGGTIDFFNTSSAANSYAWILDGTVYSANG